MRAPPHSRPEVNVRVGRHLVDFLWPDARLVVETDGYAYHRGRVAFEDDRARDLDLAAMGYRVLRVADAQAGDDAEGVARAIRDARHLPRGPRRRRPATVSGAKVGI